MGKVIEFPVKTTNNLTEEELCQEELEESYFGWTSEEYKQFYDEVSKEIWINDEKGLRVK